MDVLGFVVMVIRGLLLFYAIPVRSTRASFSREALLLVLAGVNAWVFHSKV